MSDTFRKEYTPLTDGQKEEMNKIKDHAESLEFLFNESLRLGADARCMAVAKTNLEQAIMWAVKSVTTERKTE